jgi:hypothetical protein
MKMDDTPNRPFLLNTVQDEMDEERQTENFFLRTFEKRKNKKIDSPFLSNTGCFGEIICHNLCPRGRHSDQNSKKDHGCEFLSSSPIQRSYFLRTFEKKKNKKFDLVFFRPPFFSKTGCFGKKSTGHLPELLP